MTVKDDDETFIPCSMWAVTEELDIEAVIGYLVSARRVAAALGHGEVMDIGDIAYQRSEPDSPGRDRSVEILPSWEEAARRIQQIRETEMKAMTPTRLLS